MSVLALSRDELVDLYRSPKAFNIFSQKVNICAFDTLANIMMFADGIRQRVWDTYLFDASGKPKKVEVIRSAAIENWLACCADRFIKLANTVHSVSSTGLTRSSTDPTCPPDTREGSTGGRCASILLLNLNVQALSERDQLTEEEGQRVLARAFESLKLNAEAIMLNAVSLDDDEYVPRGFFGMQPPAVTTVTIKTEYKVPEGKTLVAIQYTVGREHASHVVVFVKVNGVWYFMDNEVGASIPTGFVDNDLLDLSQLSYTTDGAGNYTITKNGKEASGYGVRVRSGTTTEFDTSVKSRIYVSVATTGGKRRRRTRRRNKKSKKTRRRY